MASITITNNSITVTGNSLTVNYTTDVSLDKVELTKDSTNYITASTYSQTSATFNISSWTNGTYSNCKLRITYEVVNSYGQIVLSTSTVSLNEAGTTTFNVKLDKAPTSNQVVNLSVNNSNCSINKTSLTFTPSNYSTNQSVTITGTHDTSSYVDKSSTITASSNNVSSKTIGVTIKNIDTQTSTGQALDDWDVYNNTYSYNAVAYMASQVGVNGKAMRITADKKTVTVTPTGGTGSVTTKDYVSGGLVTKKAFKYGTFTFKCRLSANDTYLWAMIWTLPDSNTMARPEFDLWESWGSKTSNNIVQTYHCFTETGEDKMNYQQAMTKVDLTQEHEVKAVWTEDNVFKMYVDGALKLTLKDYMVNWKTGEVDYQLWFLNLGLGTFAGDAPNGTGWMEITDYNFQPVYTKTRTKQHTYCGNWTDGTAPSGPAPGTTTPSTPTTYTVTNNLSNCTTNNNSTSVNANATYSATITASSGYNLSTLKVTMGGTDITSSVVSGNTISITNVTGNVVITASATQTTAGNTLEITAINVLSSTVASTQINYTTNKPVANHYFNMWYNGTDSAFTNGTSRVTDNGNNNYTMTFANALSAGTKNPAIKVEDASGNTYIKAFSLTVTS